MSEVIGGIKIIKYYGWEKLIINKIMKIRIPETKNLFESHLIRALLVKKTKNIYFKKNFIIVKDVFTTILPLLITVITFTLYIKVFNNDLDPAKAMATLGFFNLM